MNCPKRNSGFAHPVLVLVLVASLLIGGLFLYSTRQPTQTNTPVDTTVMGANSQTIPAPTGQIASIPKAECTIFVALTGNDSNSGTSEAQPLRTIQRAVDRATAGSAICIKGGEYRQTVDVKRKMGTASAPIKIGGYSGGGLPILSGGINPDSDFQLPNPLCTTELDRCGPRGSAGNCTDRHPCALAAMLSVMESDYIHVIGIDTRGSSGHGTTVAGSNYVLVRGLRSYHNWSQGLKLRDLGGNRRGGIDNRVEKAVIYDNILAYPEKRLIGGSGFVAVGVVGGYIKDSMVFRNFGEGLDVGRGAADFTVENNMLWENFHSSLYINAGRNINVNRNLLFCTGQRVPWMDSYNAPTGNDGYGTALTVRNEKGGSTKHGVGGGTVVANNTIVGCSKGMVVGTQADSPLKGARIVNNTIVSTRSKMGNTGAGLTLRLGTNSYYENVIVANNIITVAQENPGIDVLAGNALTHEGLRYINNFSNKAPAQVNSGFRVVDPKLSSSVGLTQNLDPADMVAQTYVITNGSPVVDTAQPVAESRNNEKEDIFGNMRTGSTFDAGSYELGGSKNWPNLYAVLMEGASEEEEEEEEDPPVCGNGTREQGEACDLGTANGVCPSSCSSSCTVNTCGGEEEETEGQNVLRNSGFAIGATEASEFARYWSFTKGRLGRASASLVDASANTLGRGKMTKLTVTDMPIRGFPSISQKDVNLDPNSTYRVSFVARSSRNAEVVVSFRDMGFIETLLAPTARFNVGTSWAIYRVNVSTTDFNPNKAAHIYVGYDAEDGSELLVDTVMIEKL